MPLVDKLPMKDFHGEISFTDTKRPMKGAMYLKNKQYELLFYESANCIGSFSVKNGDLILIYSYDYLVRPDISPKFYSEKDGSDYLERKEFLDKTSKK